MRLKTRNNNNNNNNRKGVAKKYAASVPSNRDALERWFGPYSTSLQIPRPQMFFLGGKVRSNERRKKMPHCFCCCCNRLCILHPLLYVYVCWQSSYAKCTITHQEGSQIDWSFRRS